ncbi:hypothetical protein MBRA1_001205 [Malassezia brasiliensis]|uniref:AP complex subunit beta n=1 Tax=Malassezia brasiliensis TaxID=1821822 RepID=A0AAF0DSG6_9BASI|nr:hypothetical protein MBRA1_001205 [Malassezia brasiliensis]
MADVGHDDKFFQYSTVEDLRNELTADKKGKSLARKRATLKRIIANATMGNDMQDLFPEVIECMDIAAIDVKKMVYLYIINYGNSNKDLLPLCIKGFLRDCSDPNPLIRALALSPLVFDALSRPLNNAIHDKDASVRKTAVMCIAKMHTFDPTLIETHGYVDVLKSMLLDENVKVVSNAVVALYDIVERSEKIQLRINVSIAEKLVSILGQCSEWGQTYILEMLLFYVPNTSHQAEVIAEAVSVRLQQTSASVILTSVKVIMYLLNYIASAEFRALLCRKMSTALVTLLSSPPQIQYVGLRNILLVIQRRPLVLYHDVKLFYRKHKDPLYVKLTKLEIICRLANEGNAMQVLPELRDYVTDIDVDFARKAVNSIGRIALRLESSVDAYVDALTNLAKTGANYVVQEVIIVAKDLFRKYPDQHMDLLHVLCTRLGELDEPQAKVAMIWILGQYADRIGNSEELLDDFLYTFVEEPVEVQLALLTATMKLFLKRPTAGSSLVPKVLKWATQDVTHPDCRDRGYMYWRLLSSDAEKARRVVLAQLPIIETHNDRMDRKLLDQLLLQGNSLASVYFRTPQTFIQGGKGRYLTDSAALEASAKGHAGSHLYSRASSENPVAEPHHVVPLAPISTSMSMGLSQMLSDMDSVATPNESFISDLSTSVVHGEDTEERLTSSLSRLCGSLGAEC